MQQLLLESPLAFALIIFLFALLIGSFLNVVIHRIPIMMEREWREQAEALMQSPAKNLPEGRFNLLTPAFTLPILRRRDHRIAKHTGRQLPRTWRQVREL